MMSIDEQETPRVYKHEEADIVGHCGANVVSHCGTDIVDDDKIDLSKIADNELPAKECETSLENDHHIRSSISRNTVNTKRNFSSNETSVDAAASIASGKNSNKSNTTNFSSGNNDGRTDSVHNVGNNGLKATDKATSSPGLTEQSSAQQQKHIHEGIKTAFSPINSGLMFSGHPVAQQMFHLQQCFNGLLFPGGHFPYVPPPANGLASLSPLQSIGVYSPSSWLQTPMPLVGWPLSPNFTHQFDPGQLNATLQSMSRMQQSPMFQLSPLQSPNTGALIVPLLSKVPAAAQRPTLDPSSASNPLLINPLNCTLPHHQGATVRCSSASSSTNNVGPALGGSDALNASSSSSTPNRHNNGLSDSTASAARASAPSSTNYTAKRRLKNDADAAAVRRLVAKTPSSAGVNAANSDHAGWSHVSHTNFNARTGQTLHSEKRACLPDRSMLKALSATSCSPGNENKAHIKKPLNAFMLYMKEMRPIVMEEAGLKERQSAEINRILGKRWHSLTREDQQKYYEMARRVRQEHLQMYPGWSARDNYAIHKKKKRKRDIGQDGAEPEAKKCRARFGFDQQSKWCKHCRRKKKCLWFKESESNDESAMSSASCVNAIAQVDDSDDGEYSVASDDVARSSTDDDGGGDLTLTSVKIEDGDSTPTSRASSLTVYSNGSFLKNAVGYDAARIGGRRGSLKIAASTNLLSHIADSSLRTNENAASVAATSSRLNVGGTSLFAL